MSKFLIICPSCNAKYPVADQKLSGKTVTCKKCSEKFAAVVQDDASPSEGLEPITPAGDPLADDLFGDISAFSSEGPVLATLPTRKPRKTSRRVPWVPLFLGGVGIAVVGVVVVGIYSLSSLLPDSNPYGYEQYGQVDDETAYALHREVSQKQFESTVAFVEAVEKIKGKDDLPQFVSSATGLTIYLDRLAMEIQDIPPLPSHMYARWDGEGEKDALSIEDRVKAAGEKLAKFQDFDSGYAARKFHEALGSVGGGLAAANFRTPERQAEVSRIQALKYAQANEPEKLAELRYKYALFEYKRARKAVDGFANSETSGTPYYEVFDAYRTIKKYSEELRKTPVLFGHAAVAATEEYHSQIMEQHAQTHEALEAAFRNGMPFHEESRVRSALEWSDEAQANWEAIYLPRPHPENGGKISASFLCFTPEEVQEFQKRHAAFTQRMNDRPTVVMLIDRRYAPEIELWKQEHFNDQCDELQTALIHVIWKPALDYERFFSMLLSGAWVAPAVVGEARVVVLPYNEAVLERRKLREAQKEREAENKPETSSDTSGVSPSSDDGRSTPYYQPSDDPQAAPAASSVTGREPAYVPSPENDFQRPFGRPPGPGPGRFPRPGMSFDQPTGPFPGPGFRRPGEKPNTGPEIKIREAMVARFGAENLVYLEIKATTPEQRAALHKQLEPLAIGSSKATWYDAASSVQVVLFPYKGDVHELAARFPADAVEDVFAEERRIRIKSFMPP